MRWGAHDTTTHSILARKSSCTPPVRHPFLTHPPLHPCPSPATPSPCPPTQALTDERLEAVPSVLPRLSALLPSEAALSSAVDRLAALVRSPAASQWEAALEAELPPDRLRAWCQGFDSTVTPQVRTLALLLRLLL